LEEALYADFANRQRSEKHLQREKRVSIQGKNSLLEEKHQSLGFIRELLL
jgi:hypothetical protein